MSWKDGREVHFVLYADERYARYVAKQHADRAGYEPVALHPDRAFREYPRGVTRGNLLARYNGPRNTFVEVIEQFVWPTPETTHVPMSSVIDAALNG